MSEQAKQIGGKLGDGKFEAFPRDKRFCKCYTTTCKQKAIPVMKGINIAILVLGALIFLIGCIQSGQIHAPAKVYDYIPDFDVSQKTMGIGMIMLGMFCIALGIIGLLQAKCAGVLTTLGYVIFAGLFAFILIIVGMVLGGFAGDTMFVELRDKLCNATQAVAVKDQYNRAVNAQMCSTVCPCDGSDYSVREMWESYANEANLPHAKEEDLEDWEEKKTLAYFGRADSNYSRPYPQYHSGNFYDRTTYKKRVPLKFTFDGFVNDAGEYIMYDDDDCACRTDLDAMSFNVQNQDKVDQPGADGTCKAGGSGSKAYPWCYVKETCRGAREDGFKMADGTAVRRGLSTATVNTVTTYYQECSAAGETSAMVPVPKPVYRTLEACYNTGALPYRKPLTQYLGTNTTDGKGKVTYSGEHDLALVFGNNQYRWKNNFLDKVRKFITSNGMEVLAELEDKYDCASVCEVPLFYITRDISEGMPLQECAAGIYHSMKGAYRAEAAFSIILSLILWVAMTAALMIGCGPESDKDEEEEGDNKPPRQEVYKEKETELKTEPEKKE